MLLTLALCLSLCGFFGSSYQLSREEQKTVQVRIAKKIRALTKKEKRVLGDSELKKKRLKFLIILSIVLAVLTGRGLGWMYYRKHHRVRVSTAFKEMLSGRLRKHQSSESLETPPPSHRESGKPSKGKLQRWKSEAMLVQDKLEAQKATLTAWSSSDNLLGPSQIKRLPPLTVIQQRRAKPLQRSVSMQFPGGTTPPRGARNRVTRSAPVHRSPSGQALSPPGTVH